MNDKKSLVLRITVVLLFISCGCRKEERANFRMSGIYIIEKIEQLVIDDGEEREMVYTDPGFLYLRYDGYDIFPNNPGVLNVDEATEDSLYCLDDVNGEIEFGWMTENEEKLIWQPTYEIGYSGTQICTFEILQDKKRKKKIHYSTNYITPDGNNVQIEETFFLELKKD